MFQFRLRMSGLTQTALLQFRRKSQCLKSVKIWRSLQVLVLTTNCRVGREWYDTCCAHLRALQSFGEAYAQRHLDQTGSRVRSKSRAASHQYQRAPAR